MYSYQTNNGTAAGGITAILIVFLSVALLYYAFKVTRIGFSSASNRAVRPTGASAAGGIELGAMRAPAGVQVLSVQHGYPNAQVLQQQQQQRVMQQQQPVVMGVVLDPPIVQKQPVGVPAPSSMSAAGGTVAFASYCSQCGFGLVLGSRFCPKCGSPAVDVSAQGAGGAVVPSKVV
jgi:hypothetical protein